MKKPILTLQRVAWNNLSEYRVMHETQVMIRFHMGHFTDAYSFVAMKYPGFKIKYEDWVESDIGEEL